MPFKFCGMPTSFESFTTAAIAAVEKLSKDVGIPADLKGVLKKEDVEFLAKSAYADACRPGNPRDLTVKDIEKLYAGLL